MRVSRCVITAVTVRKRVSETVCSRVRPGKKAVEVTTAPGRSDVVVIVRVWTAGASPTASTRETAGDTVAPRAGGPAGVATKLIVRVTNSVLAASTAVLVMVNAGNVIV